MALEPEVAIILTCHNHERFIGEALASALQQTVPCDVVVVDDGSTDGSRAVIRRHLGPDRTVFQEDMGQTQAFMAGLERTAAPWVLSLDSDDVLYPDAVERLLAARTPGCGKVHGPLDCVDADGAPTGRQVGAAAFLMVGDTRRQAVRLRRRQLAPGGGNLFRRDLVQEVLLRIDLADWHGGHDGPLTLGVALLAPTAVEPRPVTRYRFHGQNVSQSLDGAAFWRNDLHRRRCILALARELAPEQRHPDLRSQVLVARSNLHRCEGRPVPARDIAALVMLRLVMALRGGVTARSLIRFVRLLGGRSPRPEAWDRP